LPAAHSLQDRRGNRGARNEKIEMVRNDWRENEVSRNIRNCPTITGAKGGVVTTSQFIGSSQRETSKNKAVHEETSSMVARST